MLFTNKIYFALCNMRVVNEKQLILFFQYQRVQVDLRHIDQSQGRNRVDVGIDLSEFYLSVEWDVLEVPAIRNEEYYSCCTEPYTGKLTNMFLINLFDRYV